MQFGADHAEEAGQRNGREPCGLGDADVGVGALDGHLGLLDIRAAFQQIGRHARRDDRRRWDGFQRHAALHGAIHDVLGRASEQGFQGAFRRIAGNARLVKGRLGGFHFRLGAAQVQFADEALFITGRINPERIHTRLDRPLGGRELEIKAPQQEVGVAGLRRDGEPHAALRRFGSEHLIHGGFLGVAELAPEVKFPCRPEASRERRLRAVRDLGVVHPGLRPLCLPAQKREQFRTRHTKLRPRVVDPRHGGRDVAVGDQRLLNQRVQRGSVEALPPLFVKLFALSGIFPRLRQFHLGTLVVRRERAPSQAKHHQSYDKNTHVFSPRENASGGRAAARTCPGGMIPPGPPQSVERHGCAAPSAVLWASGAFLVKA